MIMENILFNNKTIHNMKNSNLILSILLIAPLIYGFYIITGITEREHSQWMSYLYLAIVASAVAVCVFGIMHSKRWAYLFAFAVAIALLPMIIDIPHKSWIFYFLGTVWSIKNLLDKQLKKIN